MKKREESKECNSVDDLFNYKRTPWEEFIMFIWHTPIRAIKDFKYNLKCRLQRFKRGYSGEDWWNGIGYWFANIGGQLFRDLKKHSSGVPGIFDNVEDYDQVLDDIIEGLDIAKKVHCQDAEFDVDFEKYPDNLKKMYEEQGIEIVSREKFEKAMELFTKYFGCFWD